jgi:hypothetical protein
LRGPRVKPDLERGPLFRPSDFCEIVGHSDVGLTQNVYQHVYQDVKRDAARKMDTWLSGRISRAPGCYQRWYQNCIGEGELL